MAKARRKRTQPILKFKLPTETVEGFQRFGLVRSPEEAAQWQKLAEKIRTRRAAAEREHAQLAEGRKLLDRDLAIRDGLMPPAAPQYKRIARRLPHIRPRGIGPKVWLAAKTILTLKRKGRAWVDQETLLRMIHRQLGDERLSARTLKKGLRVLRDYKLI